MPEWADVFASLPYGDRCCGFKGVSVCPDPGVQLGLQANQYSSLVLTVGVEYSRSRSVAVRC
jgi:hypothetical protein